MKTERNDAGRAIVTYARGWQSLAVTRSLGKRGVGVITGDEYALTPASFSRYSVDDFRYPSPTEKPEEFLDVLERVVLEHKPADGVPYVLMPVHKETYLIAQNRDRFEPHIRLPIPEIHQIERVHNKGTLAAYALERGLPIPRTWLPENLDDVRACAAKITLPAFVKLRESAAGVGIEKVDTRDELVSVVEEMIEQYRLAPKDFPVVQEAVPGDDYCVTTLFDRGRLIACMTYHNLRQFPAKKGAGVVRETVEAKEMEQIASDILSPLGWHGVAEIDFRWTGDTRSAPRLIEVNPRFWGGLNQAIESGWDFPWLLYQLAVHGHVEPPTDVVYDVRTEAPILGLLATLQEIAENDTRMDQFKEAWRRAEEEFTEGSKRAGLRELRSGLKDFVDVKGRAGLLKRMLEVHKDNVFDILSARDPLPVLGVFYPLAVFLKHGKINMELLTSEGGPKTSKDGEEGDG